MKFQVSGFKRCPKLRKLINYTASGTEVSTSETMNLKCHRILFASRPGRNVYIYMPDKTQVTQSTIERRLERLFQVGKYVLQRQDPFCNSFIHSNKQKYQVISAIKMLAAVWTRSLLEQKLYKPDFMVHDVKHFHKSYNISCSFFFLFFFCMIRNKITYE